MQADGESARELWRVVGGGEKGGIIVRVGEDVSSQLAEERLATGAIIRELRRQGERLQFQKLSGLGPVEGWISLRLQNGKDLVEPLPALWRVVAARAIMVRSGSSLASPEHQERLGTGAIVQEEEMLRERLRYQLLLGHGSEPQTGWVSIAVQQKTLLRPMLGTSRAVFELLRDLRDVSLQAVLRLMPGLPSSQANDVISCLEGLLLLGQADFRLKRKALRVLSIMSAHAAAALAISKSFTDADNTVRCEAALAVRSMSTHIQEGEFKTGIASLFHDACWRVRCCAAGALLHIAPVEPLKEILSDSLDGESDPDVRRMLLRLRSLEPLEPLSQPARSGQRPDPLMERKLRILAVHGANSNAAILKFQARFVKAVLPDAEWMFAEAPLIWKPVPGADDPIFREPSELEKTISKGEPFRCWYSHGNGCYNFVDEGVDSLLDQVRAKGPVDVLLCFSQGSNCVSLLLDNLRRKGIPAPWSLTVMFSGGQIDDPIFAWPEGWLSDQPTVRVYSASRDSFFQGGESSLRGMYSDLLELVHEDGHTFPHSEPRAADIYAQVAREMRARTAS